MVLYAPYQNVILSVPTKVAVSSSELVDITDYDGRIILIGKYAYAAVDTFVYKALYEIPCADVVVTGKTVTANIPDYVGFGSANIIVMLVESSITTAEVLAQL